MADIASKARFLQSEFLPQLKQISSDTLPHWGKMTLQQMVEHFSDSVRIASGKTVVTNIHTPAEHLPKMHSFLMSDKSFRENTVNPLLPEAPPPVRNASMKAALAELEQEMALFFSVFSGTPGHKTRNPFYGDLDFNENVQLLYKHACHHLRQFGVTIS